MPTTSTTAALLALSTVAGLVAAWLGTPLPFLIGPLVSAGAVATGLPHKLPTGYRFPPWLRIGFIAIIGLMIGAQVTPALVRRAPDLALGFAALVLFVGLAHGFNYAVFRRLGRYDRATAFYSATPGGLFESLAMGEAAGADVARLTLQQFLRVITVVTLLPLGLSIWLGQPVGSAGGMSLAQGSVSMSSLPAVAVAGLVGIAAGRLLRLPARQLTGPMLVAALISLSGIFTLDIPQWLVNVAQVVVGTALGMRFAGLSRTLILRGVGLSLVSVAGMLTMAGGCAAVLLPLTHQPFDVLFISFAPGGVTEMALVALSLEASPALVTLHHVWRILVTVVGLALSARWVRDGL
ncbi:MAG: AbrB family transcriptional regulator [Roseovarius sp.]|nr:AbrB family transcriptional regulator [Roseovarius sp.]